MFWLRLAFASRNAHWRLRKFIRLIIVARACKLCYRSFIVVLHPTKSGSLMSLKLITEILRQTPLWAWAILIALLAVGLSQCRDRVVKPFRVMIAPLVFLVIGALASARAGTTFAVWAVALAIVTAIAARSFPIPAGSRYVPSEGKLHLPGSVIPLTSMMAIFLINYAINVIFAMFPEVARRDDVRFGVAIVLACITGVYLGRAIRLLRLRN
jgi:hypothetical protein